MKHIKRLTALLMCAAMTCTPILTPVYAVDTDDPSVTEENRQEYIGLSIRSLPDKLYYHIGEALDLTGGRAEAAGTSLSGMKWDIFDAAMDSKYFKLNTSEFDNTKPGTYNIYIYLRGVDDETAVRADSFEVTVLADGEEAPAPKEVQQTDEIIWLNLEKSPKTLYQVGEALDLTGGTATLCHSSSDHDETKPLTEFHVNSSEFDSNTPGIYNIYVTAKENGTTATTAFTVTVTDEAPTASAPTEPTEETVTEIATTLPPTEAPHEDITFYITKSPDKVVYQIGEKLDLTGGMAFAGGTYYDGSGNVMNWDAFEQPMTYYIVDDSDFDSTRPGVYKIYLTCKGKLESKTVSFEVTVGDEPTTLTPTTEPPKYDEFFIRSPKKKYYKLGDDIDMTGTCANADGEIIPISDPRFSWDASEFDNTKPGVYTIHVNFKDGSFDRTEDFSFMVLNADGTAPDGYPTPTGTDNPYNPTDQYCPASSPEETQALDRLSRNDINGDGSSDIMDVIILNKHLLGVYQMSGLVRTFADVNFDGVIDAADSIALLKKVLGVPAQQDPAEPPTEPVTETPTMPVTQPVEITPTETRSGVVGLNGKHFFGAHYSSTGSSLRDEAVDVYTAAADYPDPEFGEKFFAEKNLIRIERMETSGSYRLTVKDVTVDENGIYTVHAERYKPSIVTCDLRWWVILVETDKGVTDASKVKVEITDVHQETTSMLQ